LIKHLAGREKKTQIRVDSDEFCGQVVFSGYPILNNLCMDGLDMDKGV